MGDFFYIAEGARLPALTAILEDNNGPMNLAAVSSVKLYMSQNGVVKVNGSLCTIEDSVNGVVSYAWGATDTSIPGIFEAQFELTIGGLKQRVPMPGYLYVQVVAAA